MSTPLPDHLRAMLDLARWAPSGDNTQPWRFEVLGDEHVRIHGHDTRDHVVYDLDGHASQLAIGALLETLALAAGTVGRRATFQRDPATPESRVVVDVRLEPAPGQEASPLAACIERRTVQRRAMSARPLAIDDRAMLSDACGAGYQVIWFEDWPARARLARFMFDNAKIRLTIPEAFQVHRSVIEWNTRYSEDRIPDQAVGADPLTLKLMRWAMASWDRIAFMNRYMLGDLAPRLQLDLIPGLFCAAHFALLAPRPPEGVDDYLEAGRAVQRFWLTACLRDLMLQPEMTPVIFTRYVRQQRPFSQVRRAWDRASALNDRLATLLAGEDPNRLVFMGRIGRGTPPWSRSLRRPLDGLLQR